ncbi:sulfurtransferase [Mycobacterium koreense]|uniref:Sulfurtransferase n=1 Tax=Mycolicibacillus koreensis TaxID=1069220 RepID=A0A7I7S7V9_9MYCO|nr:sulfurtransferase [Mycolicibacillus koreensis]MCV7247901.1 sulfurtransferase [Mycolicibacillus koreensis]OSC24879.1 sulfurtransferase [Mycolicibacillus koreensis]BBY52962.1 putative thiosulfate sulfurtransferase SseB [Mycolicibacillus koreensis]
MAARDQVLISVDEVARRIQAGDPITVLDVRWRLDEPDGRAAYLAGHLPGAVYVSLEDELSDHTVTGRGRHPLPAGSSVQAAARRWGVSADHLVVAYDDWNRVGSGRAWWVLTAAGLTNVRILDGGLAAWRAAGNAVDTGAVDPQPGDVTLEYEDLYAGALPTLNADQVAEGAATLLDARPPERYRGDNEPADAVAGHIPSAKNLPCTAVLADDGTFLDDDALGRLLADRNVEAGDALGAYCGSGISATVPVAALAVLGRRAALFPGSWSEWSADPKRVVVRGGE